MNARRALFLFTLLMMILASRAQAACIRCDQSTGWRCYMRIDGTHSNCDSPSDAGCFVWGACSPGGGGGGWCIFPDCDPFQDMRARPLTRDMELAAVRVTPPASKAVL